jgi:sugar/nucleoside kinase (ribokinase family)
MVKIAAVGDNVVDCYVSRGLMYPGGNCLNVSVFARRFGAASAYIGAIGADSAGRLIAASLNEEGVDTSRLRVVEGRTAYCVIGHRGADRMFLTSDLGVSVFEPSREDVVFLRGFDAVHVGQSSGLDRFVPAIAAAAPLSYDFSVRRDAAHREVIGPFCFLSSVSGGDIPPDQAESIADHLLALGSQWVLVTRGGEGAMLARAGAGFRVAAVPADAVDTLGAGDAFTARILFGLMRGEPPQTALEAASTAAARTCEYFGAVGHGAPLDVAADLGQMTMREL